MASLLTHKDLSRLLGVSETTVKSYRRKFPGCVPVANAGKPIRFTPEAAEVCKRIRDFFEVGMAVNEIRRRLSAEFAWIDAKEPEERQPEKEAPAPCEEHDRAVFQPVATSVASLAKSMVGISQQQNFILKRLEGLESRFENMDALSSGKQEGREHSDYAARLDRIEQELSVIGALLKEMAAGQGKESCETKASDRPAQSDFTAAQDAGRHELDSGAPPNCDAQTSSEDKEKFFVWSGLPLFARNEHGQYGNVAGRGRSRFSINDLQAVLTHRIAPPDRHALVWQRSGTEIWLLIDLSRNARKESWRLLLTPARTIKGMDILVAERVFQDGIEVSTSSLHEFVSEILG